MCSLDMSPRTALVLASLASAAHVDAAPKNSAADAAFQDHVRDFAAHSHRKIDTWGTAHLASDKQPIRFAVLEEVPAAAGAVSCGDHDCRGAYVIEAAADAIWMITFGEQRLGPKAETMRVAAWKDDWYADELDLAAGTSPKTGDPTWQIVDDPALRYKAMHNHGQLDVLFALRGGKPVVLELDDSNREDTRIKYATKGTCTRACPTVASFTYTRKNAGSDDGHAVMHMWMNPAVSGPAKWTDVHEPAAPEPPI